MENKIREKIKQFLEQKTGSPTADDLNIIDAGIIDSFSMIELIAFIEGEFHITMDMERVTRENFHSIETIAETIAACIRSEKSKKTKSGT